ncbi:Putative DNA repair helicase RadD [Sporomusa sphaeroides DSM 2875]|uniref:ATP-dependent RNA helicase DbpA n=2 Tax=Sporomusa TaxID=2375 RepID=A0ABM9W0T5_9FIRM|nr:ATP-dependent RNA helicase DbpA [Sporomusa sphaeroides DSM 2875]CVK18492.1 ATP-dependent RNA helicase DbpA [Sporomusa sphaeroides DSM 2875]
MMAHRTELVKQASNTLDRISVPHGIIKAGIAQDTSLLMQVASVGTLRRRLAKIPIPKILIVDEAQHQKSRTWSEIADYYYENDSIIIGLSATPKRLSGEPMSDCYDVMVQGPSIRQLMEWGFLCRYKYLAPPQVMNLDSVPTLAGDYAKGELFQAVAKSHITGDAIQHYERFLPGKRAIAFCVSVEHTKQVAKQFCDAGVPAEAVDGNTPDEEREAAMERFRRGETLVLVNVELYTEGADIPNCEGVIMLRPTQSLSLYIQMVGRALRPDPDNPFKIATILDHCGNVFHHDLPDADRVWTLESEVKSRRKGEAAKVFIRQCPCCYYAHKPAPVCPECGYQYQISERQLAEEAGELEEFIAREKKQLRQEVGRARTIDELKRIAKERNYEPSWVFIQAKLKNIRR